MTGCLQCNRLPQRTPREEGGERHWARLQIEFLSRSLLIRFFRLFLNKKYFYFFSYFLNVNRIFNKNKSFS